MTQNIDEIKGDLNLFNRMAKAVQFAAEVMKDHDQRVADTNSLVNQIEAKRAELQGVKDDIVRADEDLTVARVAAQSAKADAETEAKKIIDAAKKKAEDHLVEANKKVDAINADKAAAETELGELAKEIGELKKQKSSLEESTRTMTEAFEGALSKVKPKAV